MPQFAWIRWHEAMQSMNGGHKKAAKPSPHTAGTRSKQTVHLSLIQISEPTRNLRISYAVFCLKQKKRLYCSASGITRQTLSRSALNETISGADTYDFDAKL